MDDFDPYTLLADPEALGFLRVLVRCGLTSDPLDLARLAAVDAERARRRSFSQAGEVGHATTPA